MPLFFDDDDDGDDDDDDEESDPRTSLDLDEIEDAILNGEEEIHVIDQETGETSFVINQKEDEETDEETDDETDSFS